jgi:HlyD family secretion protein
LVATVIPDEAGANVGRLLLPVEGSGGLGVGQEVIVHFPQYPYLEYGAVRGEVSAVGIVPEDQAIPVEVIFPDGLRTTHGQRIEAEPFMRARATVVTDRRNLLSLLFDPN